jgi:hypothetical protein
MEANALNAKVRQLADQIIAHPPKAQQTPVRLSEAKAEVKREVVKRLRKKDRTILSTGPACG